MPSGIVIAFCHGAFVVSISGKSWHSVAIGEAHEMLINKECKNAATRPTADSINRLVHYLSYRTKALENAKKQLLPESNVSYKATCLPFSSSSSDVIFEKNVLAIMNMVEINSLLTVTHENRGLFNPFSGRHIKPRTFCISEQ